MAALVVGLLALVLAMSTQSAPSHGLSIETQAHEVERIASARHTTVQGPPLAIIHPSESDAVADVAAAVASIADLIRDVLALREGAGRYSSTCDLAEWQCLHQLSRSLFHALETVVFPAFVTGDVSFEWLVDVYGAEVVETLLADMIAGSADPAERIAALAIMEHTEGIPAKELPAAAYDRLTDRPAAEVMLALRRHEVVPITREHVAGQLEGMVGDTTLHDHYRYAAAEALGHPGTAERLNRAVGSILADEGDRTNLASRMTDAVSRCGLDCTPALEALAGSASSQMRAMAYSVLPRLRRTTVEERRELMERIAAAAPAPADMDPAERNSFERVSALLRD